MKINAKFLENYCFDYGKNIISLNESYNKYNFICYSRFSYHYFPPTDSRFLLFNNHKKGYLKGYLICG